MEILFHKEFLEHDTGSHPENKLRVMPFQHEHKDDIPDGVSLLDEVHHRSYIDKVENLSRKVGFLDGDTFVSKGSFKAATRAVGATVMASEEGDFALVRPPGHHAYPHYGSGFCFFNNIAIAVRRLVHQGKRVMIFDFDGHCGDGTSHIFYGDDRVLFCSIHQHPAFPGKGMPHETGSDKGKGFSLNVLMPPGSGDDLYRDAFKAVLPYAKAFNPDIVAVSAGFDAHQYDPLLNLRYSLDLFYEIGCDIRKHFPRNFAVLEGGYNLSILPKAMENYIAGINGEDKHHTEGVTHTGQAVADLFHSYLETLKEALHPVWGSL